jgi:ribosomal protein L11 methyltransferase
MKYKKVIFQIQPWSQTAADLTAALAAEAGCESFEELEEQLYAYAQTDLLDTSMLRELLNIFPMPDVSVGFTVTDAEDKNWNEVWENEGFAPIDIDGKCIIYDARHSEPDVLHDTLSDSKNESPLMIPIEAKQAFGTGTHETTRMIISTLFHIMMSDKCVLDCGCGTGILGIVSAKLGAKKVVAYDIDDWSVRNTKHNAHLNQVDIQVCEGDASILSHTCGNFDVVLANINRNILLADMESFVSVMSPQGILILSGFYEEDAPILLEKAISLDLHETGRKTDSNWCCLKLERNY